MSQIAFTGSEKIKRKLNFQLGVFVISRLIFNTFYRSIYPFLSVIARGLGVDLQTISYAITARSAIGVGGPFLASVADYRGRKAGMVVGTTIYTIAICLIVIWPTFPVFFLALSLAFIGYLIFVPSMQAYLGDQVPYEKRGRVLGITEFSWSLSAIFGVTLVGLIIARNGWLAPFPLIAFLGGLTVLTLIWMLPKDPAHQKGVPGFWKNFRTVFTYPPAIAALLMAAFYTAANETVTLVYGVWVEQSFSLSISSLGATALMIGIAELGGETLVTAFTDRIGKRKAIAIGLIGNCLASLALSFLGHWLAGALVSLFLFYITFEFTIVSGIPLMSEILPSARATMLASHMSLLAIGRAVGDLVAPCLFTFAILPGITTNAAAAIMFNVLAIVALAQIKIPQK
jgi:predicted MFS family arabinose efflux permease